MRTFVGLPTQLPTGARDDAAATPRFQGRITDLTFNGVPLTEGDGSRLAEFGVDAEGDAAARAEATATARETEERLAMHLVSQQQLEGRICGA